MPLQPIEIPDGITQLAISQAATRLIEMANERIDTFMRDNDSVTENFVNCDFHLVDQSLSWLEQNHLLNDRRFCELGSGFGVAAMLATLHGLESIGIEIESDLVNEACDLADALELPTNFYCGSFLPPDIPDILELGRDVEHVETHEGNVYDEIGLEMDDFDLFFAFPWPGEEHFFEAAFDAGAAVNALLLTYRGRDGMHLVRKT